MCYAFRYLDLREIRHKRSISKSLDTFVDASPMESLGLPLAPMWEMPQHSGPLPLHQRDLSLNPDPLGCARWDKH